jgi:hypothetical protein
MLLKIEDFEGRGLSYIQVNKKKGRADPIQAIRPKGE